jgi:hypothetical protein
VEPRGLEPLTPCLQSDGVDLAKPRSGALSVGEPPLYSAEQRGQCCTLQLYWFRSLGGADVGEIPSMAVDRGRPEPTQGRLPRYSARDGIGILVLSAHAEVELDVAFHVLRRFSAGAGAVQKVLEVPPASCAHDTFGQPWG